VAGNVCGQTFADTHFFSNVTKSVIDHRVSVINGIVKVLRSAQVPFRVPDVSIEKREDKLLGAATVGVTA
jgi:hypothetical protein